MASRGKTATHLSSMTGFARVEEQTGAYRWSWELRSVNGRSLDVRLRLGGGFDRLDPEVRKRLAAKLARGSVNVTLELRGDTAEDAVQIDTALLERLADLCRAKGEEPRYDRLLTVRGVVGQVEQRDRPADDPDLATAILEGLDQAIDALVAARQTEGAALARLLNDQVDQVEALVAEAASLDALRPGAIKGRVETQIAEMIGDGSNLDPVRLNQEAALLATKADIREELDRLSAHVAAARALLSDGGVIGRKFDFLTQEFNRETNTICSKSFSSDLTRIGLALKAVIDQMREQVANVE